MSTPAPHPETGQALPIEFTGSGSEYFRIWIVNLLLTLVTVGLYLPWAKVRRLRYFYGNTLVGGYALDFHGDPKKMLRGTLLVGALLVLYSVAGHVSPVAGGVALILLAGLWPALMRSALQFRLANTSWRGLRFRFRGGMRSAYAVFVPILLPVLGWIGVMMWAPSEHPSPADEAPLVIALSLLPLLFLGLLPWVTYRLYRYRQSHYALGPWRTRFETGPGAFYRLSLKTFGVTLLVVCLAGIAIGLVAAATAFGAGPGARPWISVLMPLLVLLAYAGLFAVSGPYFQARQQDLVWNATRGGEVQFRSALRFRPLALLTLRNLVLCVLTLGLYWPFAKVALARLRLQAVQVTTRHPVDDLISGAGTRSHSAAGDAAGELLGIDVAL